LGSGEGKSITQGSKKAEGKAAGKKAVGKRAAGKSAGKKAVGKRAAGKRAAGKSKAVKSAAGSGAAGGRAKGKGKVRGGDPMEVAREMVKGSMPEIVGAMVMEAKNGSHSHAKTLLEMSGVRHMFEEEAAQAGEPWAKLVLERLGEAEPDSGPENEKLDKM
jgi:hypothetical protein